MLFRIARNRNSNWPDTSGLFRRTNEFDEFIGMGKPVFRRNKFGFAGGGITTQRNDIANTGGANTLKNIIEVSLT